MPDEISQLLRRLDATERNQTDQAKTLSKVIEEIQSAHDAIIQLREWRAVEAAREEARDDWRKRTEGNLNRIYNLGWWVLAVFGTTAIGLFANFLFRGGLFLAPTP